MEYGTPLLKAGDPVLGVNLGGGTLGGVTLQDLFGTPYLQVVRCLLLRRDAFILVRPRAPRTGILHETSRHQHRRLLTLGRQLLKEFSDPVGPERARFIIQASHVN